MSSPAVGDPALPGLGSALAGGPELSGALDRALRAASGGGWGVAAVRLVRFRHRPGERAILQLDLKLHGPDGSGTRPAALWLFAGDKAAREAIELPAALPGEPPAGAHDPWSGGLLTVFPHDRGVGTIRALMSDPDRHAGTLMGQPAASPPEPVRYRPGLGATLRWRGLGRAVYVKLHRGDPQAAAERIQRVSAASRGIGIVPVGVSGIDPSIGALALEEAPGIPFETAICGLGAPEVAAAARRVASALVRFGGLDPALGRGRRLDADGFLDRAARARRVIAGADAEAGHDAAVLLRDLEANRPALHDGLAHLDMKPEHVFVGDDGLTLVDLDSMGVGDPLYDIAMLKARIHHLALAGHCGPHQASAALDAIDRETPAGVEPRRLGWLGAIAAFQIARYEVQRLSPGWRDRARSILASHAPACC